MCDGRVGASPDLDRLAERVEIAVAERVPHVRVVDAAGPAGLGRERRQLLGGRERAGRVVEAGADADRAIRHRLAEPPAHPVDGGGVGRGVLPTHGVDPEGGIAHERPDVDADRAVEPGEVARDRVPVQVDLRPPVEAGVELHERLEVRTRRERGEPVPVDPDDLGGDALADLGLVARLRQDDEAAVAVQVDEPRRHHPSRGVDPATDTLRQVGIGRQEPQPLPVDDDTPGAPRSARPVDDRPARDQEIRVVSHVLDRRRPARPGRPIVGREPTHRAPCPDARGRSGGSSGPRGHRR